MLAKFCGLNQKGPCLRLEKNKETFCVVLTYSIERAREIRKFSCRATTAKKCTKTRDARAKLFSCCSPLPLKKLPLVVIQKFCYHGNVTSHFSSLLK